MSMEDSTISSAKKATKRTAESKLAKKAKRMKWAKLLEEEKRAAETRIARARIFQRALNARQENVEPKIVDKDPNSPSSSSLSDSSSSSGSGWSTRNASNGFNSYPDDSSSDGEYFFTGTDGDNGSML